jgi:hypothetical protein
LSPTYTLPDESTATPTGILNLALVPVPSADPSELLPANVVTTPDGVILRILKLAKSATYRFPAESSATPKGLLKLALVPVPLVDPDELPANVVTTPADVILRIRWLL